MGEYPVHSSADRAQFDDRRVLDANPGNICRINQTCLCNTHVIVLL